MKNLVYVLLIFSLLGCSRQIENKYDPSMYWGHRFSVANDVKYGELDEQLMDIYSQGEWIGEPEYWKPDAASHPTLVYIHGGGWLGGSKNQITPFILPYLEAGYNVVSLEYRKGEATAPAAVDDCMLALQWINRHASEYNVDRKNIVISGESAGGHLCLITGMLNSIKGSHRYYCGDSLKVKAIVNWFGITDIAGVDKFYSAKRQPENYASIWVGPKQRMDSISNTFSPMRRIVSTTPPIITIHGRKDSVVPYEQAVGFHSLLSEAGIRNELITVDNGKHLGFTDSEFKNIYSHIFQFLDR
jgi:acetyl esterase/lipase